MATPKHNGKVERQHREDGRKQLAAYNKRSNSIPKVCLKFRSPTEVLEDHLSVMW